MAIQIVPMMKSGDANAVIDKVIAAINNSGIKFRVGPCETVMEGTHEELTGVLEAAQQVCFDAGADDILVNVKIERSRGRDMTIERAIGKFA